MEIGSNVFLKSQERSFAFHDIKSFVMHAADGYNFILRRQHNNWYISWLNSLILSKVPFIAFLSIIGARKTHK
jgi:hypothetical protein